MWVGFLFAAYSALPMTPFRRSVRLSLRIEGAHGGSYGFIGGVFGTTVTVSWLTYGGPISVDLSGLLLKMLRVNRPCEWITETTIFKRSDYS